MAAAVALARRGCHVTIVDTGLTPEPEARALKARMAETEPEDWHAEDLVQLKRTGPVSANGIPHKLHFSSDFTFQNVNDATALDLRGASMYRSFAAGGFSNVWGAVIQPLGLKDMQDWPIALADLAPHYAAVRALLCDHLDEESTELSFPPDGSLPDIRPSSQARALHADLVASKQELARQGIRFDYARLAMRAFDRDGEKGCRYCGLCLYGCPYDSIYTASSTLTRLIRDGIVNYVPGVWVDKLSRVNGCIRIEGRSLREGARRTFQARRVFVAAGLLETSRIILTSLRLYDTPLQVKHSDIFTLPAVRYRATTSVCQEELHTLCQIVAEIEDEKICEHRVRLQFYGYNDLYSKLLAQKLGWLGPLLKPALRTVAARLFVIFGYLHSSVSSSMKITLRSAGDPTLHVEGQPNPLAEHITRAVARKLFRNRRCFQAIPLPLEIRLDLPGGGYHSGGTFPMRRTPGMSETDLWGSLPSLCGVHLIDASILPTVPASTTAFTVMANAHRIASECPLPHDS